MSGIDLRHEWEFADDFFGGGTLVTSAGLDPWVVTDTSSAGSPTYARVDLGESSVTGANGSLNFAFSNTNEVQNLCLSFGNKLAFDINKVRGFECRVKMGQAAVNAATSFACGLTTIRDDDIDTIEYQSLFRVVGADSTTALVCETDDSLSDNDDVATGTTLINTWKRLKILYPAGLTSVQFFVDDIPVATGTTFDMTGYDAGLQPFFQIQKTASTNTDSFQLDYVRVWGVR